ncbi:23574_t:CDS:1, partial [Gigaspora margarita]
LNLSDIRVGMLSTLGVIVYDDKLCKSCCTILINHTRKYSERLLSKKEKKQKESCQLTRNRSSRINQDKVILFYASNELLY